MTLNSQPSMAGFCDLSRGWVRGEFFPRVLWRLCPNLSLPFLWGAEAGGFSMNLFSFPLPEALAHALLGQSSQLAGDDTSQMHFPVDTPAEHPPRERQWGPYLERCLRRPCWQMFSYCEQFSAWITFFCGWTEWSVWAVAEASSKQISTAALRGSSPSPKENTLFSMNKGQRGLYCDFTYGNFR